MKKSFILLMMVLSLFMVGCNNGNENNPSTEHPPVENEEKVLELRELEVLDNGNNVVYLGETFTAKGYDINLVYRVVGSKNEYEKVKCENFNIDDSNVNYEKLGTYQVVFSVRVKNRILKKPVTIRIADSRLIELKIRHLYGIKAEDYTGANIKVGQTDLSGVNTVVYLIYTSGEYENDELVLSEERKRSGYELDYSEVNVNVAGEYPVYISYKESYDVDGETIEVVVKTFFLVEVEN